MKRTSTLLCCFALITLAACDGPVSTPTLGVMYPVSGDSVAVAWKPLMSDSINGDIVPAPGTDSEGLDAVRAAVANREAAKAAIDRWNAGTVYAWSIITRQLVGKYNVAPQAERTPDGSFTGRFLSDPNKPFANPPFAARLFALVSVAQYDALLKTWSVKYKYNRPRPYQTDPSITRSAPDPKTPSYPNEDAVIARAVFEVLVSFFPLERTYLETQLKECNDSRLAAGLARPSDIAAGDSIGKAYGLQAIAYGKADGFSKADDQARWKTQEAAMVTDYPRWKSIETPARPPMLPYFGEVRTWHIASGAAVDPGPPPSSTTEAFLKDMDEMRSLTKDRTREQVRIAGFWSDGEGTFTPPGHWWYDYTNQRAHNAGYSPVRYARVMAYTATALHDAGVACWYSKYKYATARPITVDPSVRMPIGLPNFPGYTSGHSSFSGAAATVLAHFFPSDGPGLMSMAIEAGDSRVYACIHVRVDCTVGLKLGKTVGQAAVDRAMLDE